MAMFGGKSASVSAARETPASWVRGKVAAGLGAFGMSEREAYRRAGQIVDPLVALTPLGMAEDAVVQSRQYTRDMKAGKTPGMFGNWGVAMAALGAVPGGRAVGGGVKSGIARKVADDLGIDIESAKRLIDDARKNYRHVGLRTVEDSLDTIAASRVWRDGVPTNRKLSGVSTTSAEHPDAFMAHQFEPMDWSRHGVGYYPGDYTYVVAGNKARRGRDNGELVINDPVIIGGGKRR